MDFAYTPAQQELKARAAAYAELLMGYEDEAEQAGGPLPKETVDKLTRAAMDAGMFGINMPAEWGGAGLTLLEQVIVEEEFGKVTNCLWDIPWRPANVLAHASRRAARALPAADPARRAVRRVRDHRTRRRLGRRRDRDHRDAGRRRLASSTARSGSSPAATSPTSCSCRRMCCRATSPTLFLVDKDTPGVRISRTPHFMHSFVYGTRSSPSTDVFVADDAVLGEVGQGYELTKDWFTDERLMIAARTVGAAERALRLARDWAISASSSASRSRLPADPGHARRLRRRHRGQPRLHPPGRVGGRQRRRPQDAARQGGHGQALRVEAAGRVVDRCLQIFGGRGYVRAYPVERLYRELRVDRIWEGTSEIQRLIIANELIKRGTAFLDLPVA